MGWPEIATGGTDSIHNGEDGISQKTSEDLNFGDEKVGLSEVNLPGGYEPGPKSESWTWMWSNKAELEQGRGRWVPCQRPQLLPALLRAFGAGLLISSH